MLFDWEEDNLLNDYGPYIASHMPNALDKNRNLSGGTLYGFGHNVAVSADDHEAYVYYPYLRYDLYKAAGSPAINTLEDFVPALKAMQALEPVSDAGTTTYGVSLFPDWDGAMVMVVKSTAALYGWDEFGFGLYDVENQVYEDALKEDGWYLRCLKFYNMLYQEGLLDPDSMTQTFDDMNEKYTNGSAMFNIFSWMASPFNTPEHMNAGKAMQAVAAKDQKNLVYGLNMFGSNRIWAIGSKTNYPELCMAIIDWFSTPDGALTAWYGPKGVTWDYDADGNTYLTELGLQAQQDKENTQITYGGNTGSYRDGEFQHNNTTWSVDTVNVDSASGETYNYVFWESTLENKPITAIEQEWRDDMGYLDTDAYLEGNGFQAVAQASDFSMASRDAELETTWTQVQTAIRSGSWSAIYAESDAEYNEIVAKMIADAKAYGYDECVAWTQEQANLRKEAEDRAR
jgi:multiple sugar transport system substrate-binding protein/putative aldouronate transport system substrate-binding protein